MDFDVQDDNMILLLLVASSVRNLLRVLPKSRCQLVRVKHWLQCRSTEIVYHSIISELKQQGRYGYRKKFA